MQNKIAIAGLGLLLTVCQLTHDGPLRAAETWAADQKLGLSLRAGAHDRSDVFVSPLIEIGQARSVFVEYADGTLGRAQLLEPGLLNAAARGSGKKELHFIMPKLKSGEAVDVVAALSANPVEGRTYVWSGESRQSRRLSCMPCHQGLAPPTAAELRQEWQLLEQTGEVPALKLPRLLPTAKGYDHRWHEKLGQQLSSACWECHARHMVQYEYGQSLARDLAWAPDPAHRAQAPAATSPRSVFHTVFRVRGDRTVSHPLPTGNVSADPLPTWGIHYGFERATVGQELCSHVVQQHARTLSEEAGKFIGRHNVQIDWNGMLRGQRTTIAHEERQVTVKDYRGRNRSYAMWIDFVSTLSPAAAALHLDGGRPPTGLQFVPGVDGGTVPAYREGGGWPAMTFVSEGTTYTVVCLNAAGNPPPRAAVPAPSGSSDGQSPAAELPPRLGYSFSAACERARPLTVHYRLWIQGGTMPDAEIQAVSDDFREPPELVVK